MARHDAVKGAVFFIVCLLLLPAILIGYVLWIGKAYVGRRAGVSGTAQGPLSARWFQHRLGTRLDLAAERLLLKLPGVSPLAVWLVFGPLLVAHRLSGFVPQMFRYPFEGEITFQNQAAARQTFYDGLVDRYVPDGGQLVILGAGFDTRAFRIPRGRRVRSFEVDLPKTQAIKREALRRAGIELADVCLVSTDFEHHDWLARLIDAGFDRNTPALFLWEGVTPYLSSAAVNATLRKVASTSKGSVVGFDYFTTEVLESKSPALRMLRASLNASGEPLKFGVDGTPPLRDGVARWLQECGLSLADHRVVGNESETTRAWGGFAIAIVE